MSDQDHLDDRTVVAAEDSAGGSLPGQGGTRRPVSLAPGDVLNGIYRVDRFIARGGMGEVFEGVNVESDERVAIKAIRSHLAQDAKVIAMFRKEARVLTQISHPAIVQYRVLARDPVLDLHYIVTDFIDGEALSAQLARRRPPVPEILALARRLALGLGAAHDHGAVHRDMSPDNVILPDGAVDRAKIIDFGIAKSLDVAAETVIGDGFAGKLGYVAPEQFGDFERDIGPWTDIYSTALVLVAFARGHAPDMGSSLADAVHRRGDVPDLDGIPEVLEPLLRRMLEPDPAKRLRSMAEVLSTIDALDLTAVSDETQIDEPFEFRPERTATKTLAKHKERTIFVGPVASASEQASRNKASAQKARLLRHAFILCPLLLLIAGLGGWGTRDVPNASGTRQVRMPLPKSSTTVSTPAPASRISARLADRPCTWVFANDPGDAGSLIFTGAAGQKKNFDHQLAVLASQIGLQAQKLELNDVLPLSQSQCKVVERLRSYDHSTADDRLLGISTSRTLLGRGGRACPTGGGAPTEVWIEELDPERDFALISLEAGGQTKKIFAGRDEFLRLSKINPSHYYTDNRSRFHVSLCFNSAGTAGVILIDGQGSKKFETLKRGGSDGSRNLLEYIDTKGARELWRSRAAWLTVEDAPKISEIRNKRAKPIEENAASENAVPKSSTDNASGGTNKYMDQGHTRLVDVATLATEHGSKSTGSNGCYEYDKKWKFLGNTSKSACILSVFFKKCLTKNGQFGEISFQRNGEFIEQRRGNRWRPILTDKQCK